MDAETRPDPIDYEGKPSHAYVRDLPFRRLRRIVRETVGTLDGKSVLLAGCGVGTDAHYLRKHFRPDITFCDISTADLRTARRNFPEYPALAGDVLGLPFPAAAFDVVLVTFALHHLRHPVAGLYELMRVAREGVFLLEPNDCWTTRLATRLGLMQEIEDEGNYVYKFSRRDIERVARADFRDFRADPLFAPNLHALDGARFHLFRALIHLLNLLIPRQGNVIVGFLGARRTTGP